MIMLERDGSLRRDERVQERARTSGSRWEHLARRAGAVLAQARAGIDRGWRLRAAPPPVRPSLKHKRLPRR